MTCKEFEELSGAFALDAVTPAERLAAEEHLATCAKCARLFQEIRGVVSLLPLSVPQIPPPPALQDRILAAIHEESNGITGQPTQRITSVQPQRARRPRWNPGILVAAAALMFCLLGGSLAGNFSLNHQVAVLQQQVAQLTTHPQTSSNVVSYTVKGINPAQGATGLVYYYPQQHVSMLVIYGLPQPKGTHVYQ
ncbi:MAG TPA: anti-sigma factor, partial [Ktedonobacteraceae bacterium]